jgi:hypothetical protein
VIYGEPEMQGKIVTSEPTSSVAFSRYGGTYINLAGIVSLVDAKGNVLCSMTYKGRSNYAVSSDGQWLALSQSDGVDVWRIDDLLHGCSTKP